MTRQRHLKHIIRARLGIEAVVQETTSPARAAEQLEASVATGGPTMTWVDMSHLPYRGMPSQWSGGGYHVIVVHEIDAVGGNAVVSDLADEPIVVPLAAVAEARGRIRKFKHRILTVPPAHVTKSQLTAAVRSGLRAGAHSIRSGANRNFTLAAVDTLAQRMRGANGKESWDSVFPRGPHLWTALTWIYDCVEHFGTGGGLCRPMMAEGLVEAAELVGRDVWSRTAEAFTALGTAWTHMAAAALPLSTPAFAEARGLLHDKAERFLSEGATGADAYEDLWTRSRALTPRTPEEFPLDDAACVELRMELADRLECIAAQERRALDGLWATL